MAVFTKRIDANIRDVDNTNSGGSWTPNLSSAYNIGNPGAVTRNISLRFTDVTIAQGTTINSAKITFVAYGTKTVALVSKIEGVDEDNTAEFVISPEDTARTRTKTTANVAWSGSIGQTNGNGLDTPEIKTIVQEIINRGSWSSGNAMAFWLSDNGTGSGEYLSLYEYNDDPTKAALLTIDYDSGTTTSTSTSTTTTTTSTSTSTSTSTTTSVSLTTSTSTTSTTTSTSTTTTSTSTTTTTTSTTTTLPIFPLPFSGVKFSKEKINVLQTNDPRNLTFSSRYPNLKYFEKGHIRLSFNAGDLDISATGIYQHNLGYYPFVEAFSSVYIEGSPTGVYEYCPFFGSGATVAYSTNYRITKTTVQFYGQISGESSDIWVFDFIFFIFKNNLGF